ncbi:hypothetical protein IC214_13640 [Clostridioides sp. ES-S-0190-01]|uniref:hypothetical protein n=1 Tax=Clostridioides sp. ES-S-0049-02 TaxID=2770778 RepID=UPI001D121AC6|nr:hypothetical protein [Clostridioides sp. ES-S-0049-02]MCC0708044.1 hypothetical protein [Clostridioides sp. ES-S-0190-01]
MDNILIIFICTIVIYLLFILIDKKMTRIRFRFREREFEIKYPTMSSLITFLIKYIAMILLFIFTVLQEKTQFMRIPLNCDPIVLTVAIYTMYGIFISFIQFLISYSSANNRDLYWGKSKTKLIIMDSIEYRMFNSELFRMLLLYLSVYSILNFKKIFLLSKYNGYAESLFYVSITIIIMEFIVLFIKGLMISNVLFYVQEDRDRINRQIKITILKEYQFVFNETIKSKNLDFIEILFVDLSNIEKSQREEMVYSVLCHVYSWYQWVGESKDKKILLPLKKIFKRVEKENSYYKLVSLRLINSNFWNQYEKSELKLQFEELLKIYIKQEDFMFNFIKKESGDDKEKFSSMFERVYKTDNTLLGEINFLDLPTAIWKAIFSQEDIISLCNSVRNLQMMKMLDHLFKSSDYYCTELLREKIIEQYCKFIIKVFNKKKEIILQMDSRKIADTLDIKICKQEKRNFNQIQGEDTCRTYINFREELKRLLKYKLLHYFIELENNELNRSFINKLGEFMEEKYIMFFITYRILYTGSDYSKWREEIVFFKNLISSRHYEDNILGKQNVDFVAEAIANVNIGHKISYDLINWIFHNINSPINENIVKACSERRYLSLATFISFKYIFKDGCFYYRILEDINFLNDEIRIQFINEISKIRGVMKEEYFIKVLYDIFDCQKYKIGIDKLILNSNFEMLMIVNDFINIKNMMEYISKHEWRGNDGVLKFLLIKFSEFNYQELLSSLDFEVQHNIAQQFERILSQSLKTVDKYVDDLCIRASYLGNEVPQHRKDKAINILSKLILG